MSDPVYQLMELTGTSANSIEDAIQHAIQHAAKTNHDLRWLQVVETRGMIKDGKVAQWQVILKVGYRLGEGP